MGHIHIPQPINKKDNQSIQTYRKEPRYTIIFSQNIPSSETPPGSPTGPLWREIPDYRTFYISLDICLFISKALRNNRPSMSPKAGPLWKQAPIPELQLTYLSGSPVKEPSLQVPLLESPRREITRLTCGRSGTGDNHTQWRWLLATWVAEEYFSVCFPRAVCIIIFKNTICSFDSTGWGAIVRSFPDPANTLIPHFSRWLCFKSPSLQLKLKVRKYSTPTKKKI
jgi:hypothetical protein